MEPHAQHFSFLTLRQGLTEVHGQALNSQSSCLSLTPGENPCLIDTQESVTWSPQPPAAEGRPHLPAPPAHQARAKPHKQTEGGSQGVQLPMAPMRSIPQVLHWAPDCLPYTV